MGSKGVLTNGEWSFARAAIFWIAAAHVFLSLVIQVENYLFTLHRAQEGIGPVAIFVLRLGLGQGELMLVALVLGSLFLLTFRPLSQSNHRPKPGLLRVVYFLLLATANLYLVLNQVTYKVFLDHWQFSMNEGRMYRLDLLWSSFVAEIDGVFWFNLFFWLGLNIFLYRLLWRQVEPIVFSGPDRKWRWLVIGVVLYLAGSSLFIQSATDPTHLSRHPLLCLLRSGLAEWFPAPKDDVALDNDGLLPMTELYRLRYGTQEEPAGERESLQLIRQLVQQRQRQPNVILLVLESVGSVQFLDVQRLSPQITPVLHRLAQHGLLFPDLYAPFPGTVRSHVPMNTGGPTITWGSVYDELSHPYQGPTLARVFKNLGYHTGLFAAMDMEGENMAGFYQQLNYDIFFHFGLADAQFQQAHRLHSWGGEEDAFRKRAIAWIDTQVSQAQPFFLHFLTVATHHPYLVPEGHLGPLSGKNRQEQYFNALHYTDAVIGRLVDDLQARSLLDNTILAITGDHGEAFGTWHGGNFLHKNHLYEENIRSFLLLIDPQTIPLFTRSSRLASMGDILPTLVALIPAPPVEVTGQNLLADDYRPRLVYFHKSHLTEWWGLRDGPWKYLAPKTGDEAQLYDLTNDPHEQRNLAALHPEQIDLYHRLCTSWYIQTSHDFIGRLEHFSLCPTGPTGQNSAKPGPQAIAMGYRPDYGKFVAGERFHPYEKIMAWTRWQPYSQIQELRCRWKSPSAIIYEYDFQLQPGWLTAWINPRFALPLEEGQWSLTLQEGHEERLSQCFTVERSASLSVPLEERLPRCQSLAVGYYPASASHFLQRETVPATARLGLSIQWASSPFRYRLTHQWITPSGAVQSAPEELAEAAEQTVLAAPLTLPLEKGAWRVRLSLADGTPLGETSFAVE